MPGQPVRRPVDNRRIAHFLRKVREVVDRFDAPVVSLIAQGSRDPFRVLISTILSARTKDDITAAASERLFEVADSAAAVALLPVGRLEKLIFPVGFYRTKAENLRKTCRALVERFESRVPDTIEELVGLAGVGRKTANLVLIEGFRKPAVCVDTHVHRITNLWGYVDTSSPEKTEWALRAKLPMRHWLDLNRLLVSFGQHTCVPISPRCSDCPLQRSCPRIGVERSR